MGAWDVGNFDNDDALDYVKSIESVETIVQTIQSLMESIAPLEAPDASIALAACDVLAICIHRPAQSPPGLPDMTDADVSDAQLDQAKALVMRVRSSSELAELWAESEELEEWHAVLDDLIYRLTLSTPYEPPAVKKVAWSEDCIGHCYICYGEVTRESGLKFEFTMEGGGTLGCTPHRACVEKRLEGPGPHWKDDGSPADEARRLLLGDMGVENSE